MRTFTIVLTLWSAVLCAQNRSIRLLMQTDMGYRVSGYTYNNFRQQLAKEMEAHGLESVSIANSVFNFSTRSTLISEAMIEGIEKVYVVKAKIVYRFGPKFAPSVIFTDSVTIKGTGSSYEDAFSNGLNKSRIGDQIFPKFRAQGISCLNENKEKYMMYLQEKRQQKKFEYCLSMLYCISDDVIWHKEVAALEKELFAESQTQSCKEHIRLAQLNLTRGYIDEAIYMLSLVASGSPCEADYQNLLEKIRVKADKAQEANIKSLEKRKMNYAEDQIYITTQIIK